MLPFLRRGSLVWYAPVYQKTYLGSLNSNEAFVARETRTYAAVIASLCSTNEIMFENYNFPLTTPHGFFVLFQPSHAAACYTQVLDLRSMLIMNKSILKWQAEMTLTSWLEYRDKRHASFCVWYNLRQFQYSNWCSFIKIV